VPLGATGMWRARGALQRPASIGVGTVASVAFFAARGSTRTAILVFAALKLVVYWISVTRRPEYPRRGRRLRRRARDSARRDSVRDGALAAARQYLAQIAGRCCLGGRGGHTRRVASRRTGTSTTTTSFTLVQMAALYCFYRGGCCLSTAAR
jgi:hypothetical protein